MDERSYLTTTWRSTGMVCRAKSVLRLDGMSPGDDDLDPMRRLTTRRKLAYTALLMALVASGLEVVARLATDASDFERYGQRVATWMDTGLADFNGCLEPDVRSFWRLAPNRSLPVDRSRPFLGEIANAAGLRGRELTPPREGVLRVLALGDSCTFGFAATEDEAWPARLEVLLRAGLGRDVEVFNAGVPGYSSFQGLGAAERWMSQVSPDVVLLCFGWNDSSIWDGRTDAEHATSRSAGTWERLEASRAFLVLRKLMFSLRRSGGAAGDALAPRVPPDEFAGHLARMAALARDGGAEPAYLVWPFRKQMEGEPVALTPYQRRSHAGPGAVVDLLAGFREAGITADAYVDGGHVGPETYALVARLVADGLPWRADPPWAHGVAPASGR